MVSIAVPFVCSEKSDYKAIEKAHKNANDAFKIKHQKRNPNGYWINMVYQTVPYDAIKGSASVGLGMSGVNHRLKTLGHDPILGWLFGTANILTDTISSVQGIILSVFL